MQKSGTKKFAVHRKTQKKRKKEKKKHQSMRTHLSCKSF